MDCHLKNHRALSCIPFTALTVPGWSSWTCIVQEDYEGLKDWLYIRFQKTWITCKLRNAEGKAKHQAVVWLTLSGKEGTGSTNNRKRTMDTAIFNVKLVHFTFLKLRRILKVFYHYFHNRHCNCLGGDNPKDLPSLKLRTEHLNQKGQEFTTEFISSRKLLI